MLVCVDVETTGPDPANHEIVEIAWWNFHTRDTFVPPHTLRHADPHALAINRYYERHLDAGWDDGTHLRRFHHAITGNWIVGSNAGFDWAFLRALFTREQLDLTPLAYPPLDLGVYAAGRLGRPITDRVGLTQLCRILGVTPGNHTAAEDVRACGQCLVKLGFNPAMR